MLGPGYMRGTLEGQCSAQVGAIYGWPLTYLHCSWHSSLSVHSFMSPGLEGKDS